MKDTDALFLFALIKGNFVKISFFIFFKLLTSY